MEGVAFLPPPAASRACQPCFVPFAKKRQKKSAEMGPGTALCLKIIVPAGTRIKFLSADLKIGVSAGTVLKNYSVVRHSILGNLKHSFFYFFSTYLFWPYIVERAWAEKLILLASRF